MVDLHKQFQPRRCSTITQYAPPASMRLVDSLPHNRAFYLVNSSCIAQQWLSIKTYVLKIVVRCITFRQN